MRSAEPIEVARPRSLDEALALLAADPSLTPLAGGTDLLVLANAGALGPVRRFLDLWPLDELRGISVDRVDGRVRLSFGALTTFTDCIASRAVAQHLPILARAAREVGGVQIQNRGTLAGNVGNASPAADSLPVLAACDTEVVLAARGSERAVPLDGYYTGYRKSVRRGDELIVRLRVTVPRGEQSFRKVGTRAAQAISKVVMAAIRAPGDHRVAFGSVAPTVVRARSVERYLDGGGRDAGEAARLLAGEIRPIDDLRSSAAYRLRVAQNLVASLLA
jgi:CO/xanthine dehydrogenase FAD-binding subunit